MVNLINGTSLPLAIRQTLAQATAAALGGVVGGNAGLIAGLNVEANNRQLHQTESEKLTGLKQGKSPEEQQRLNAAACALVRCADGVPQSDPYYGLLKGLQEKGATYQDEMTALLKTGEFLYQPFWDAARDALTRNGEVTQRAGGATGMLAGAVGVVGGGSLAASGAVGCGPTAGASCTLVPLGAYIAAVSNDQLHSGTQAAFGSYNSKEGKRVVDSFDIATYPGERDPLIEIGIDAGKLGLTYLLGKYLPSAMVKAEEKLITASLQKPSSSKLVIDSDKFKYIFGEVDSNQHNLSRSEQIMTQMKRLGINNDQNGRNQLIEHLEKVVAAEGNIARTFSNQYGTFEVRDSLFIGPSGQAAKFETTFRVLDDGTRQFSTLIPKGGLPNNGMERNPRQF